MRVVINKCYGGFGVSEAVYKELNIPWDGYGYISNKDLGIESDNYLAYRADERLINAIEKIGLEESSSRHSELRIVEVPDGVEWEIDEYDGIETIRKKSEYYG